MKDKNKKTSRLRVFKRKKLLIHIGLKWRNIDMIEKSINWKIEFMEMFLNLVFKLLNRWNSKKRNIKNMKPEIMQMNLKSKSMILKTEN